MWCTGLVALQHVGSSWVRDQTHVSCIGRQILYHCVSNTLATWWEEPTQCKNLMLRKGRRKGGSRGWGGWMASPTQWAWVWANSGRWWRTGKPDVLQSMGSPRVRHDWAPEQQQRKETPWYFSQLRIYPCCLYTCLILWLGVMFLGHTFLRLLWKLLPCLLALKVGE